MSRCPLLQDAARLFPAYIFTCLTLVRVFSCCENLTGWKVSPHWRVSRGMGYDADREVCQRVLGMRCHYRLQGSASHQRQTRLKVATPLCSTGRVVGGVTYKLQGRTRFCMLLRL
jgi:hypothetical protein